MSEYTSTSENVTDLINSTVKPCAKSCNVWIEIILVGNYIVGIVGNLIAFLHLCRKRSFKNSRHPLMLKCLISNNLVGLIGMLILHLTANHLLPALDCPTSFKEWTCIGRVLFRFFGLSSGCVALVMALERFLALTKPFTYQQFITKRLIGKTILCLWIFVFCWTCLPFIGFGLYINKAHDECINYKEAREEKDIIYAYLMFGLGMILCSGIVICNLSVTKVLCKAHFSRRGSTSSLYYQQVNIKHMTRTLFQISSRPSFNSTVPTSEEIRFAKLMLILSISFVICWCPQMITIILYQVLPSPAYDGRNFVKLFSKVSDFLLLLHFVSDPYIYVLLRNNRQRNKFNDMIKKILSAKTKNNPNDEDQQNLSLDNVMNCNTHMLINLNNGTTNNDDPNMSNRRASAVCFSSTVLDNNGSAGQTHGGSSWN
uniref:CSON004325 protein n=1 Tax=Culicoides sonorensis TaxID=179676 RepID=A0A336MNL7_CULSO